MVAPTATPGAGVRSQPWAKVLVTLSTHDAGGLTEYDFALAAKIDQLED